MLLTRKLRNLPITAVRFIRAVKYFFAEHIKVPHDVEPQQVIAIHRDISKPLLGATETKEVVISLDFIQNLLRSMAGLRVHELQPWHLSSAYIFVYFVISRHKNDSVCMEAYDYMLKGETPTSAVIKHVVNDIIFKSGNLNVTNNQSCEGLMQNQIYNFRRTLQKDCCQNELQVLVAWPEDLGLIDSSNERGNMENEMLHYFKLFEINYYLKNKDPEECSENNFSNSIEDNSNSTSVKQSKNMNNKLENRINYSTADAVDKLNYLENKDPEESSVNNFSNSIEDYSNSTSVKQSKNMDNKLENRINYSTADDVDKLNYLENKDTEESSVNNFSNVIEDNSNSTSVKQSKNIDKKLENCSLKVENQNENITKRILRPRINAKHKKDEIEGRRITRSKSKIILINLDVVEKESQDNSKKIIESNNDVKEHEFRCRKTLRRPLYGGPERPIEINYSIDTPEADLINDTMQLDIETSSVISNSVDTVIQERNNEIQDIPVNEENEIVKAVVSSKHINEKLDYSSNVNKSLDSSNHNEKLQSVSTAKALFNENADISIKDSSNITKSLNSEITCKNNENVGAEVNFTADLSSKNNKPKPVSQDTQEKADIVESDSNDNILCSLNSSTKKEEITINLKSANEKSNNNAVNNESHVISINDTSKYRSIQSFIGNCCMAKSYDSPNKNKFPNTSGTSTDLIVNPIQLEKVTNSEISNEIDKVKQKNSNKIQDILEKKKNKIVKPVADSVFNKNKTRIVNENGRAGVKIISELSNKNQKPMSQDSKEKADTFSNDIDTNLASSKDINRKSREKDDKSHGRAWRRNLVDSWNILLEEEPITLIGSAATTTSKNLVPTTVMGNEKQDSHSDANQANQANQNNLETDHLIGQSQDSQTEKKPIKNSLKFISSAIDSPVQTATTNSNFTASNANSGSTLKRESITVVDLDFEPTRLNSKRANQSPHELPTVKKMCFESRSNSCEMDFPIPVATTSSNLTASNNHSDSTLKRKSITVIDLDLEPCMLNSNVMSQPLQDPPKSPMYIPIPASPTNSSFTAEYRDSSFYIKKEITTKEENPDLEIVEIKNNTLDRSISGIKMSSNTASMPTLTPGPFSILFANSDLSKNLKRKSAAAIRQNAVDNFSRRSIPMDWQSKTATINEPLTGLIFTTGQKATPTSQASLTEMNGVNPVDQHNPSQSQQYPLQDQQQSCLFASCHDVNDNTFSSSFNNDSSKFQSNIQQNTDTTNVGGNFSVHAGPPLNPRLTSFTVSDRPTSTIQLAEKNKIGSAVQEDILQPTLSTDMSTVHDQFPLNRADGEYSNTSSVKPRLLTKVRITPLQQPNFQLNGKRYPTHCSDAQHYNLINNASTLCNCLPAQQQQQSMRYVFNSATANSTAAVARHGVNGVLTPVSKLWQAPVNLNNLHYFCDYCPIQLKFESAEQLYQHVNDAHNYSCQLCQNRYPTHQALLQHINEHTGNTSTKQVIGVHNELCKLELEYSLMFGSK